MISWPHRSRFIIIVFPRFKGYTFDCSLPAAYRLPAPFLCNIVLYFYRQIKNLSSRDEFASELFPINRVFSFSILLRIVDLSCRNKSIYTHITRRNDIKIVSD